MTSHVAFSTPAQAPRWKRLLVYSPPARIAIFCALTLALVMGFYWVLRIAGYSPKGLPQGVPGIVQYVTLVTASVVSYLFLVRVIEKRNPVEFGIRSAPRNFSLGAVSGAALMTIVVGLMWIAGSYSIARVAPDIVWWPALLTAGIGAAVFEEVLFRGVIYRIVEEGLGTWAALLVSSLFFGGVHLVNPGAYLWGAVAIAIEAGLLFGMLYNVTRSLWLCIGLHMGWNFTQGTVWGVPVSGSAGDSFFVSLRSGPEWLTGGTWGAEGSLLAVVVCLVATLALARLALRQGTIVKRKRAPAPVVDVGLVAPGNA